MVTDRKTKHRITQALVQPVNNSDLLVEMRRQAISGGRNLSQQVLFALREWLAIQAKKGVQ